MTQRLLALTTRALDEFTHTVNLQELLKLCLEEIGDSPDTSETLRIYLLLSTYLSQMEHHTSELQFALEAIQRKLLEI